ncbi:hypothetical protein ARMGADRAFT_1101606 [Armillaria gallica]|uniref:Uncharacterized protein n=1 Tax=Armillaria gallica TaxID=47427 RepID=A0A2H3DWR1_ARMGA|nr:hypothetical protein ARMGADRAFT_1101606 [Armillaria gallica]
MSPSLLAVTFDVSIRLFRGCIETPACGIEERGGSVARKTKFDEHQSRLFIISSTFSLRLTTYIGISASSKKYYSFTCIRKLEHAPIVVLRGRRGILSKMRSRSDEAHQRTNGTIDLWSTALLIAQEGTIEAGGRSGTPLRMEDDGLDSHETAITEDLNHFQYSNGDQAQVMNPIFPPHLFL